MLCEVVKKFVVSLLEQQKQTLSEDQLQTDPLVQQVFVFNLSFLPHFIYLLLSPVHSVGRQTEGIACYTQSGS